MTYAVAAREPLGAKSYMADGRDFPLARRTLLRLRRAVHHGGAPTWGDSLVPFGVLDLTLEVVREALHQRWRESLAPAYRHARLPPAVLECAPCVEWTMTCDDVHSVVWLAHTSAAPPSGTLPMLLLVRWTSLSVRGTSEYSTAPLVGGCVTRGEVAVSTAADDSAYHDAMGRCVAHALASPVGAEWMAHLVAAAVQNTPAEYLPTPVESAP